MDVIEIRTPPELYVQWPEGGGFQQAEILINREPLIEIIRQIEFPYAVREFDERDVAGELAGDLETRGSLAGDYLYLSSEMTFSPSRNFFGSPYKHGFLTQNNDPTNYKSLILQCTCGIAECWFLMAKITTMKHTVVWSDFQQFHRYWTYDLQPFVFARKQYEAAFSRQNNHNAPEP